MTKKILTSVIPNIDTPNLFIRIYDIIKKIVTPPPPGNIDESNKKELEKPLILKRIDSKELILL
jgi:hypothetical protein